MHLFIPITGAGGDDMYSPQRYPTPLYRQYPGPVGLIKVQNRPGTGHDCVGPCSNPVAR